MAKPITNRLKNSKTPVIRKDLDGGVIAEANNDGSIHVDKSVKKGSALEREAIAHEKVHLDQMKRGDLNYDDNNVYWKGKVYPRSSMNEGAKNLPWEKEAYDKTKHMKNKKKSAPTKMSDADLVANNKQTHKGFKNYNKLFEDAFEKPRKKLNKKENSNEEEVVDGNENTNSSSNLLNYNTPSKSDIAKGFSNTSDYKFGGDAVDVDSAFLMKATPITYKSKNSSPLNRNGGGGGITTKATKEYDAIMGGQYGRAKITKSDIAEGFRTGKIPQARGGSPQAEDQQDYMAKLRTREDLKGLTGAELAAGKWIHKDRIAEMDAKYPAIKEPQNASAESSKEVEFKPYTVQEPGKPGEPGTYNMPFYEARNLTLAARQKRQAQNEEVRRATRDYYKIRKKLGEKVSRKDRKPINPETLQQFTEKEYMEYRAKAKSSFQNPAKKRYDGKMATRGTTRTAIASDAPEGTVRLDAQGNIVSNDNSMKARLDKVAKDMGLSYTPPATKMSSNENKTAFKMKGYGSKYKK